MATVTQPVRIVLVVLFLVLLAGLFSAPDAPRFSFGGETYAVKALGIRRVLIGLGMLGFAAWRLRRGTKAAEVVTQQAEPLTQQAEPLTQQPELPSQPGVAEDAAGHAEAPDRMAEWQGEVNWRLAVLEQKVLQLMAPSPAASPARKRPAKKREAK